LTLKPILLVLTSSVLHAAWNYLAKKSGDKLSFLFAVKTTSLVILTPVILFYLTGSAAIREGLANYRLLVVLALASGLIHSLYNFFLSRAYEYGDISVSYPIARGMAPFLVALFSFFFLGETPSSAGISGMALIALGIFLLVKSRPPQEMEVEGREEVSYFNLKNPVLFAILTAIMISLYVSFDGLGSRNFTPLSFMYFYSFVSIIFLSIPISRSPGVLFRELRENKGAIFAGGVMMPLSYLLALHAMRLSQLGYVASLRNVSVVFAAFLGFLWLDEPFTPFRLGGSAIVFLGALFLGFG